MIHALTDKLRNKAKGHISYDEQESIKGFRSHGFPPKLHTAV